MTHRLWSLAVLSMMLAFEAAPWAALSEGWDGCSCTPAACCCAPRTSQRSCHESPGLGRYVRCHHPQREASPPVVVAVLPAAATFAAEDAPAGHLRTPAAARARDGFAGLDPPPPRRLFPLV